VGVGGYRGIKSSESVTPSIIVIDVGVDTCPIGEDISPSCCYINDMEESWISERFWQDSMVQVVLIG
jgi:hypothetical protein